MTKIVLTDVRFKRGVFEVIGECVPEKKENIFFINSKTKQRINLHIDEWKNGIFKASALMFGCNNDQPIETGHWYIAVEDENGKAVRASVSDDLYDRIYLFKESDTVIDFMVDKSENNYFYAFS